MTLCNLPCLEEGGILWQFGGVQVVVFLLHIGHWESQVNLGDSQVYGSTVRWYKTVGLSFQGLRLASESR